jgi:hypothetical protein
MQESSSKTTAQIQRRSVLYCKIGPQENTKVNCSIVRGHPAPHPH